MGKLRPVAGGGVFQGEEVSKEQKERLVILFWIVVCVTILPPLFFGEARSIKDQAGGDSWRNFIFDFQTLIGGGAAILAAWYTVRQMRITDEKSEARHRELVALQLRSDRLRVERMLFPALDDLEDCYDAISDVKIETLKLLASHEPNSVASVLEQINSDCHDALSITLRPTFKEARDLLDGDLNYGYGLLQEHLNNLRDVCIVCRNRCVSMQHHLTNNNETLAASQRKRVLDDLDEIDRLRKTLLITFSDFCVNLALMKKEYGIH